MQFIEDLTEKEYTKFWESTPNNHFLQSYEWGEACKAKTERAETEETESEPRTNRTRHEKGRLNMRQDPRVFTGVLQYKSSAPRFHGRMKGEFL